MALLVPSFFSPLPSFSLPSSHLFNHLSMTVSCLSILVRTRTEAHSAPVRFRTSASSEKTTCLATTKTASPRAHAQNWVFKMCPTPHAAHVSSLMVSWELKPGGIVDRGHDKTTVGVWVRGLHMTKIMKISFPSHQNAVFEVEFGLLS